MPITERHERKKAKTFTSAQIDTPVHMSTVYTRSKPNKRKFGFVICGLLMGTALFASALTISGGNVASAATSHPVTQSVAQVKQVSVKYQSDQKLAKQLKLAVKAIKDSGISSERLASLYEKLDEIYAEAKTKGISRR